MKKNKSLFITFLLLLLVIYNSLNAQGKNSVYSMFGIGQIIDNSYGINKAFGGTGIAFQSGRSMNYLNPAGYIGIAPNSIVMESGIYGMLNTSNSDATKQTDSDLNFSYFSTSFYLANWWVFNFGITPYSSIDFEINTEDEVEGELTSFEKKFTGSGGLKRIYFGNSFRIIDRLTVGFNTSFVFGSISQIETALNNDNFAGYQLRSERDVYSFYLDYGIQYSDMFNDWSYTIGLTYGASQTLNSKDQLDYIYGGRVNSIKEETLPDIKLPQKFGVGLAAKHGNTFRAGIDYQWKNWSDISFTNTKFEPKDSHRFSTGIEYSPSSRDKFYNNFYYRLGANYKISYLEIENTPINSFAVNLGLGIPYDDSSIFNLSIEYGEEGTLDKGLIKNSFWVMYFNFSFHEFLAIIDPQR